MQLKFLNSEKGAPILEMLLFTPLALMLLFVGTDFGLAYIESANLTDAVRSGLSREGYCSKKLLASGEISVNSIELSAAEQDALLRCLALEIGSNVTHSIRVGTGFPGSSYRVQVSLVSLQIDPASGKYLGKNIREISLNADDSGSLSLPAEVEGTFVDREVYLNSELAGEALIPISRFALPQGQVYTSFDPGQSLVRYHDRAHLVHAELVAASRTIGRGFVETFVGRPFMVQVQEIAPLRMQLY